MSAEFLHQLLIAIAFTAPFVAAIWKISEAIQLQKRALEVQIETLEDRLVHLQHAAELKAAQIEALNDKLSLALNGVRETADHVRTRTKNDFDLLNSRLSQIEKFLAKTTSYEPRT
jgi:phage-related minor tail protein